jgi:hypothetical protein
LKESMMRTLVFLSCVLISKLAYAEPASQPVSQEAPPPNIAPQALAVVTLPWTQPSGKGVAFAYDDGSWGGTWMQGVRVRIPLHPYFGMNIRGIMLMDFGPSPIRIDMGGRLELFGQSPVFLNLFRLYGGGGVEVFRPITPVTGQLLPVDIGGGGYFGFEFFLTPRVSWLLELGGHGGSSAHAAGATINAGIQFYPF